MQIKTLLQDQLKTTLFVIITEQDNLSYNIINLSYKSLMRIFISMPDQTGSKKTTRLTITNCNDTSELIKIICKQLVINKKSFIFLLKNEIVNLRLLDNWPLSLYGVKNGSWIILKQNQLFHKKQLSNSSTASLQNIQQEQLDIASQGQTSFDNGVKQSFFSQIVEPDYHEYYDKELAKMLNFVRANSLQEIATLLKQQPDIQQDDLRDRIFTKKNVYVLNEIGQCGRNALHWAIHNQNVQIISFLLIKCADPSTLTIDEYTPLQLAVVHRNIQIVKILLSQPKVDSNRVTTHGTALHIAAYHHSIELIKILLQHGANLQQLDKQGRKAVDLSQIQQIRLIFEDHQKKLKLRLLKPNITKGPVLKISTLTYRGKERTLTINPFKNQISLNKQNNQIDNIFKLSKISDVEKITEKSWLMDSKLNYVKISYQSGQSEQKILLAIKNPKILSRWLNSIELARTYASNQKYVSKIQPQMQLIEIIDDNKNQIKVHKRQVKNQKYQMHRKNTYSIIDMKVTDEQETTQVTKSEKKSYPTTRKNQQELMPEVCFEEDDNLHKSFNSSDKEGDGDNFCQSEILLGSILMQKNLEDSILSTRNTISVTSLNTNNSIFENQFHTQPKPTSSSFRKKSFDTVQISQFKFEQKKKITFNDFQFMSQLGSGAFGQVYLTKHQKTGKVYAMKVLNKKKLLAKKQLKYAVSQTNILKKVNHPFIIGLHMSFQTPSNLYLALDYCPYGDLSQVLCQKQRFSQSSAKFIIAQTILAVQYLHSLKIIYRDLKPQNILVSKDGFIKLIDFGLSKQKNFSTSFCGSPAYLSPQMLDKKGHSFPTDIYGLGCVLYEMVIGEPPYFDQNMDNMFQNIRNGRLKFPGYLSKQLKALLGRMLQRDVTKRIGTKNMKQVKSHQFFQGFSWQKLYRKQLSVPKQILMDLDDSGYFALQNKLIQQNINYSDQDYSQNSMMLNRIKGFSFCRQQS